MSGLLILGAGGHGKVIADIAAMLGKWDTISFLDDRVEIEEVVGFPVIGKLKEFISYKDSFGDACIAIGNNKIRLKWLQILADAGFSIPAIIHPSSTISRFSRIGDGTAVMAGVVINASADIGRGCILNTCSSIDHDCILEDGVHVSPGVHVSGTVNIGRCSWVCVGSNITNNISIGNDVIVAAGAVVVHDVPDNVLVAGVPAIIKKKLGVDSI